MRQPLSVLASRYLHDDDNMIALASRACVRPGHGQAHRSLWRHVGSRVTIFGFAALCALAGLARAQTIDACSVLPATAIATALGTAPVGEGKRVDIGARHTCDWQLLDRISLRVAVFSSAAANTLGPDATPAWHPVPGLGRQAGYRRSTFTPRVASAEVEAVVANRSFFVQATGNPLKLPSRGKLIALAKEVAENLK